MIRRRRFLPGRLILPFLLTGLITASAWCQEPGLEPSADTSARSGRLYVVQWRAELLGRHEAGSACWLREDTGALRLEVLPGRSGRGLLTDLLEQRGQGYTLVLSDRGGTFNAWEREWRPVTPAAVGWLGWLAPLLEGQAPAAGESPPGVVPLPPARPARIFRPRFLPDRAGAPGAGRWLAELPRLQDVSGAPVRESEPDGSDFRNLLTARSRGRGGDREILTLVRRPRRGPFSWQLTSSRKPGRLLLSDSDTWRAGPVGPEVFTPLWPLSLLLEVGPKISGTPPDAGR